MNRYKDRKTPTKRKNEMKAERRIKFGARKQESPACDAAIF